MSIKIVSGSLDSDTGRGTATFSFGSNQVTFSGYHDDIFKQALIFFNDTHGYLVDSAVRLLRSKANRWVIDIV